MQSDLDYISLCCFKNQMTLNAGKCIHLEFRGSSELFMGPRVREQVLEHVGLGVVIDKKSERKMP